MVQGRVGAGLQLVEGFKDARCQVSQCYQAVLLQQIDGSGPIICMYCCMWDM